MMNKCLCVAAAAGWSLCLCAAATADEIQFTTLPKTVQTTVIREARIPDGSGVTQVVRDSGGVYAVTVRSANGPRVVYVDDSGTVVQAPTATTTTTVRAPASTTTVLPAPATTVERSVQTTEPTTESTIVTYDQVQENAPRYQLLEKKGNKEIYLDRQTNQKVTVKRN